MSKQYNTAYYDTCKINALNSQPILIFPRWLTGKESTCHSRRHRRLGFNPWVRKIPWSRKWQPTLIFLPGKFHGQRRLAGCSPGGCQESDTTEYAHIDLCSIQFISVTQSCPTLCDPMDSIMPGFPVHHRLPELAQTHVHQVSDAIQPSHPLSSPSPPAFNLSQHQGLFQ